LNQTFLHFGTQEFLMKIVYVLIILLCGINAVAQENAASLPELQEWYSIKGGGYSPFISYLPGFDSLGGGMNAITQERSRSYAPVFYNRFPFDTTAQFQWKSDGAYIIAQIDFNNDGIHDYLDRKGRLYTGSKKGEKPNPEPIYQFSDGIVLDYFIHDFNSDTYPDMLIWYEGYPFAIIFGGKDLRNLQRVLVTQPRKTYDPNSFTYTQYVGAYSNENGKPRILIYGIEAYSEGFYLYGIRTASKGDSVEIFLDELDKIEVEKEEKDQPQKYWYLLSAIYQQSHNSIPFFNIYEAPQIDGGRPQPRGFTIENDKFIKNRDNSRFARIGSNLGGSVDHDSIPDFFAFDEVTENNQLRRVYMLYTGNPRFSDNIPKAFFYEPKCTNVSIYYIGDVNGDGIGDVGFTCFDYFAIYLGLDWRKVSVNEVAEYNSFKLHQNIPNPVQKDRKTLLPVSLKQQGNYSIVLYSLQGSRIKDLFNGELSEGDHKIPLDLMGLSAGMYIVKMNNGSISRERAIMIGE